MILAIMREIEKPGTGKTETRRVIALRDDWPAPHSVSAVDGKAICRWHSGARQDVRLPVPCSLGDRLYVREAWQAWAEFDKLPPRDIPPDSDVLYSADRPDTPWDARKRIGMHMPRWASRITLVVNEVRVEQLCEITEEAAIAEGIEWVRAHGMPNVGGWRHYTWENRGLRDPRESYRTLWDNLNASRGYGWDANPWVVVIRFSPHLCNIDQMEG